MSRTPRNLLALSLLLLCLALGATILLMPASKEQVNPLPVAELSIREGKKVTLRGQQGVTRQDAMGALKAIADAGYYGESNRQCRDGQTRQINGSGTSSQAAPQHK